MWTPYEGTARTAPSNAICVQAQLHHRMLLVHFPQPNEKKQYEKKWAKQEGERDPALLAYIFSPSAFMMLRQMSCLWAISHEILSRPISNKSHVVHFSVIMVVFSQGPF